MRLKIGKRDEYFQTTSAHWMFSWLQNRTYDLGVDNQPWIDLIHCKGCVFVLSFYRLHSDRPRAAVAVAPAATKAPGCAFLYHRVLSIAAYRGIAQKVYVEVNFQNSWKYHLPKGLILTPPPLKLRYKTYKIELVFGVQRNASVFVYSIVK